MRQVTNSILCIILGSGLGFILHRWWISPDLKKHKDDAKMYKAQLEQAKLTIFKLHLKRAKERGIDVEVDDSGR
jgi:hypothetical protein